MWSFIVVSMISALLLAILFGCLTPNSWNVYQSEVKLIFKRPLLSRLALFSMCLFFTLGSVLGFYCGADGDRNGIGLGWIELLGASITGILIFTHGTPQSFEFDLLTRRYHFIRGFKHHSMEGSFDEILGVFAKPGKMQKFVGIRWKQTGRTRPPDIFVSINQYEARRSAPKDMELLAKALQVTELGERDPYW